MIPTIGNYSLAFSFIAAIAASVLALLAAQHGSRALLSAARWTTGLFAFLVTISIWALLRSFLSDDFRVEYVVRYSELALGTGFKAAAVWAGQEGSLLLWAWLLAVFAVAYAMVSARHQGKDVAFSMATLMAVCAFFAALLLYAANPFKTSPQPPLDGLGLNPLLQDPAMILHPPLLFIGYAGFTVPFAMVIGVLCAARTDSLWTRLIRRWTMVAWAFLTVGIILGAEWAYVELGWGGYWAWDPVENASLLPWLTATALLHSIMVQSEEGMLKRWNASLAIVTFLLCILGTYITRSGVIDSVHAFGKSWIGLFLLAFLVLCTAVALGLMIWRRQITRRETPIDSLLSREGMFLATNILLTLMTVVILVATLFPVISTGLIGHKVTAPQAFYNTVVNPIGLLLVAMMAVGPLLSRGREGEARMLKSLGLPLTVAAVAIIVAAALGWTSIWALTTAGIIGLALTSILVDLVRVIAQRMSSQGENPVLALFKAIDTRHRRYGGQIVHVGVLMIVLGIVGSSVYGTKHTAQIHKGQTVQIADHAVTLLDVRESTEPGRNYTAVQAPIRIVDKSGKVFELTPERRFYHKAENPIGEVALDSTLQRDLYVTLAGWGQGGHVASIQVSINPLVNWIWIGGIVLCFGALFAILPRFTGRVDAAAQTVEIKPPARRARVTV